jgi:glycosyltransferase involved in cell wall biosynthesis
MTEAAFLVLPSSYEGMPHVVLEAFAVGLPVVASNAPGNAEIIENRVSGLLYRWGDLDELETAMRIATSQRLSSVIVRGGIATAERLSIAAMTSATSRVLGELIAN